MWSSTIIGMMFAKSGAIPAVSLTIGGATTTCMDSGQVLNGGGVDSGNCLNGAFVSGRMDESHPWVQIGSSALSARDTAGNAYAVARDVNDGSAGDRTVVFAAISVQTLAAGASVTLTYPSSAERHVSVDEFAGFRGGISPYRVLPARSAGAAS
jgi:hypothetical protein